VSHAHDLNATGTELIEDLSNMSGPSIGRPDQGYTFKPILPVLVREKCRPVCSNDRLTRSRVSLHNEVLVDRIGDQVVLVGLERGEDRREVT
jgi:hypothetical protein